MNPKCLVIGLLVLIFLVGCGLWYQPLQGPGITQWDYKQACGICHKLPKPKTRTDVQWEEFMKEHRLVAGQDEETAELYTDYLKQNN